MYIFASTHETFTKIDHKTKLKIFKHIEIIQNALCDLNRIKLEISSRKTIEQIL